MAMWTGVLAVMNGAVWFLSERFLRAEQSMGFVEELKRMMHAMNVRDVRRDLQ